MALDKFVTDTIQEGLEACLAIDTVEVTEVAKKIAFYSAMIDAAKEDPLDEADDQTEVLEHMESILTELIETYQSLVNDLL